MARIDPGLHRELKAFGAQGITSCMNCGNCTATCPQATEDQLFPRRIIHMVQAGMKDQLRASAEPWLCYYCGDCSETCPRDANPGESMMAVRRYLTASYDWTGLGGWFYKYPAVQMAAMLLTSLAVVLLFAFLHGPVVLDHVALNTFAPVEGIEFADKVGAVFLGGMLLMNAARMAWRILRSDPTQKIPYGLLVREIMLVPLHLLTQKKWLTCDPKPQDRSFASRFAWLRSTRWIKHFFLVTGYLTMIILVEGFLKDFQTDTVQPIYHWTRLTGYYATIVLLWNATDFFISRMRKSEQIHRFSTASDWAFLVLLILTALTGIAVHILRLSDLPMATYVMYVIHMAIVGPFLIIQVPFGKWSHMLYRPLAVYLTTVKQRAREEARTAEPRLASV